MLLFRKCLSTVTFVESFGVGNGFGDMLKQTDTTANNENSMALFFGAENL
jgi:hypothetical protein